MIALDANGADRGPATVAEGGRLSGVPVTLYGPAAELAGFEPVVDAPVAIGNTETISTGNDFRSGSFLIKLANSTPSTPGMSTSVTTRSYI